MYGISLQSSMPVLGTDYEVTEELPPDVLLYRYQMVGSLATVLFPQHWTSFQQWLQRKQFHTQHGMLLSLSLLNAFANGTAASALSPSAISSPCIPSLASNAWWLAWHDKYRHAAPTNVTLQFAIDHLFPLFFARFLYETGYYALFPHFPTHQRLLLQSEEDKVRTVYSWSAEKEAVLRLDPDSKPRVLSVLPFYSALPSLSSLPLYDLPGWDVNGRVQVDEQRKEEDDRLEARRGQAAAEEDDDSMSLSKRGNLLRSAVLPARVHQWLHSDQCSIVVRDKRVEQGREDSLLAGGGTGRGQRRHQRRSGRRGGAEAPAAPCQERGDACQAAAAAARGGAGRGRGGGGGQDGVPQALGQRQRGREERRLVSSSSSSSGAASQPRCPSPLRLHHTAAC